MHLSVSIYTTILDPHKNSTCFYVGSDNKLHYSIEKNKQIEPTSLQIVQEKISELINEGNFVHRSPRSKEQLLRNVEIVNAKIELHNERVKKSILYCILHCFGIEWRIIKKISTDKIQEAIQQNNQRPERASQYKRISGGSLPL